MSPPLMVGDLGDEVPRGFPLRHHRRSGGARTGRRHLRPYPVMKVGAEDVGASALGETFWCSRYRDPIAHPARRSRSSRLAPTKSHVFAPAPFWHIQCLLHGMRDVLLRAALVVGLVTSVFGCAGADGDPAAETDAASSEALHAEGFRYPFQTWDHDGAQRDMPVSIIFVSKHPHMVDRVYGQVEARPIGLTDSGAEMTLSGVGGSRPGVHSTDPWTSHSAGRKGAWGCWGKCADHTDIHLRTYGPDGHDGTQVYQGSHGTWPYYLVATTHFDVSENTPQERFGYQDVARRLLVDKLVRAGEWRVVGSVDVHNACSRRIDSKHFCKHDGRALVVSIDG